MAEKKSKKIKKEKKKKLSLFSAEINFLSKGFSRAEAIIFFRNLTMMISCGVSIVEALEICADQVKSRAAKKAILTMANDTRNGMMLSKAMAKFPKYFPDYIRETVEMGDVSGTITETMNRIADDLEKDEELKKKINGAIMYPAIIFVLMILVIFAFAFYILPGIANVFKEFGASTPLPTKIILGLGEILRNYPFQIIGTIIGIFLIFLILLKIKLTRYYLHYIILRTPIFGDLIKNYNLVLIFRSLKTLFKSGISLNNAIRIAAKTTTNDVYKKTLLFLEPAIIHGTPLSQTLTLSPFLFPKQTQKVIWVGEKTGQMEHTLEKLSDFYEKATDYRVRILTVMIEPVLMIIIGLAVALLALSLFMPIYGLINVL